MTALFINLTVIVFFGTFCWLADAQLEGRREEVARSLSRVLGYRFNQSRAMLAELAPLIQKKNGSIPAVRAIINDRVIRAGENLRIAWSDNDRQLRVGTMVGVFIDEARMSGVKSATVDLSHRDYIRFAMQEPGTIVVSSIKPHGITGRNFFAIAVGVIDEAGENYLGCLASINDVESLQNLFASMLEGEGIDVRINLAGGDELYASPAAPLKLAHTRKEHGFSISTSLKPGARQEAAYTYLKKALFFLLVINGTLLVIFWGVRRFYIRPMRELEATFLNLPESLIPPSGEENDSARLVERAQKIKDLLMEYHGSQEEAQAHMASLKKAIGQIHAMHSEQALFLNTLSAEMREAFMAIHHYAGFLEGEVEEEYYHSEGLFLENLKDSAQNLKFLSNVFYLICLQKSGRYSPVIRNVEVVPLFRQIIALFGASLEFRSIDFKFAEPRKPVAIVYDESILRHLFWGAAFLAIKYAGDGATLKLEVQGGEEISIRLEASDCLEAYIPRVDEDLAPFFPKSLDKTRMLEEVVANHVNYKVMAQLLEFVNGRGELAVHAEYKEGKRMGFALTLRLIPLDDVA